MKFLSEKYNIKIEKELRKTGERHKDLKLKQNISTNENNRKKDNYTCDNKGKDFDLKNSSKSNILNCHKEVVANYHYRDEQGNILYKIYRRGKFMRIC